MKHHLKKRLCHTVSHMIRCEDGSSTILALLFIMIFIVMGGIAIDFNKVISERTQLQMAADSAAHAALYTREKHAATQAREKAISTVSSLLPSSTFGTGALTSADVNFGTWDAATATFTAESSSKSAVKVVAGMTEARNNPSRNLLLNIIGQDTFNVSVESVYSTYYPPCLTEGFVAEKVVTIRSNNSFTDGFCIHSNAYVSMNQNNHFEAGTVVSLPDLAGLDIPKSGFKTNDGLQTALRSGHHRLRLLNNLRDIIDSFWAASPEYLPPYVSAALYEVSEADLAVPDAGGNTYYKGQGLTPQHFEPNVVNFLYCYGSGKITLNEGIYSNFLFVSDCEVTFANGVFLEDVVIATTDIGARSFNSPSGLTIGRDDNCAVGGGATLMTLGGVNVAASLDVFGGQILALGDIKFAANADGIQGASFVSYGSIEGTSNMNMGYCQNMGMENAYRAEYFRMVR